MLHFISTGPRYVTPAELADMLGVTRARVYALMKANRLTPLKVPKRSGKGTRPMFAYDDAVRWARERREQKENG